MKRFYGKIGIVILLFCLALRGIYLLDFYDDESVNITFRDVEQQPSYRFGKPSMGNKGVMPMTNPLIGISMPSYVNHEDINYRKYNNRLLYSSNSSKSYIKSSESKSLLPLKNRISFQSNISVNNVSSHGNNMVVNNNFNWNAVNFHRGRRPSVKDISIPDDEIVMTGQRFGNLCASGHHNFDSNGVCSTCGAKVTITYDPITGGVKVEWDLSKVPLDNPVHSLLLLSLVYVFVLILKHKFH